MDELNNTNPYRELPKEALLERIASLESQLANSQVEKQKVCKPTLVSRIFSKFAIGITILNMIIFGLIIGVIALAIFFGRTKVFKVIWWILKNIVFGFFLGMLF